MVQHNPLLLVLALAALLPFRYNSTLITTTTTDPFGFRVWIVDSNVSLIATQVQSFMFTSFYASRQSQDVAFTGDEQGRLYMWIVSTQANPIILGGHISVFPNSPIFGINFAPTTNLISVDGGNGRTAVVNKLNNGTLELLTSDFRFKTEFDCKALNDPSFVWTVSGCRVDCSMKNHSQGKIDDVTCNCAEGYVWNVTVCVSRQSTFLLPESTGWDAMSSLVFSKGCKYFSNGQCICPQRYMFSTEADMCVVNCSSIANTNGYDSILSCQCTDSHRWNVTSMGCDLDCGNIPFSQGFSADNESCECIAGISWNKTALICQKDCSLIINASGTDPNSLDQCSCNPSYSYNVVNQTCQLNCSNKANVNSTATEAAEPKQIAEAGCICETDYQWDWEKLECTKKGLSKPAAIGVGVGVAAAAVATTVGITVGVTSGVVGGTTAATTTTAAVAGTTLGVATTTVTTTATGTVAGATVGATTTGVGTGIGTAGTTAGAATGATAGTGGAFGTTTGTGAAASAGTTAGTAAGTSASAGTTGTGVSGGSTSTFLIVPGQATANVAVPGVFVVHPRTRTFMRGWFS